MPTTHWTYKDFKTEDDLFQGDILAPTAELRSLFQEIHPHFCDDKYLGFIVTTQSCDLERRLPEKQCSARYISVATIRSLTEVLPTLLETVCNKLHSNVFLNKDKSRASDLLERIFNQNEQKLGLFYLAPDAAIGIAEEAVAFLRVSVAFRAEHYEEMRLARRGRLRGEFSNKLGWLLGNLYSRIGTTDWTKEQLQDKISSFINTKQPEAPIWSGLPPNLRTA